ncbi:MAG: 4'-phosphopantetheinyl transferase superfamily protein [Acidobacteriota bacterium]|jgi:4'-phosphopantetheinyl transferase|nr:4'-phosphopantetheinyl transferase superfamily protein [Acidobacteriota bacterium]
MLEVIILTPGRDLTKDEFDGFLPLVSTERRARIGRCRRFRDAQNALLGEVLTRMEICRKTGLCNRHLRFSTNRHGKPFLASNPRIHYNVSHAGPHVAVAMDEHPVGIDVELVKPVDLEVARRFFAPDETEYVMGAPVDSRMGRFFQIWTMKESRVKWEGRGMSRPLSSFSVLDPGERAAVAYHQILFDGVAVCHVCTSRRDRPCCKTMDVDAVRLGLQGLRT